MTEAILLHSSNEFQKALEIRPSIRQNAHIYFLTQSVDEDEVRQSGISFSYFDELLSDDDFNRIYFAAMEIAQTWYLDLSGNDCSAIEGWSFGTSMYYFVHHVVCQSLKYQTFLEKAASRHSSFVLTRTKDPLIEIALDHTLRNHGKPTPPISYIDSKDSETLVPTPMSVYRTRDLSNHFSAKPTPSTFVRYGLARLTQLLCRVRRKKKIVLTTAGKSTSMVNYLASHTLEAQYVLQLNSDSFRRFFSNVYFYFFPFKTSSKQKLTNVRKQLQRGLHGFPLLPKTALEEILNRYILGHLEGSYRYYVNVRRQLKAVQPSLVVLSADRHEINVLIALAAKELGIKTATLPHGWPLAVLPRDYYALGPKQVYQSALVLSKSYQKENIATGYDENQIFTASLHYFFKLKKEAPKHPQKSLSRSALILAPDWSDTTRMKHQRIGIQTAIDVCLDIGIRKLGVKTRLELDIRNLSIRNSQFRYRDVWIGVYSGYTELAKYACEFDILIGGFSSATIESLLQGFQFFTYMPPDAGVGLWDISTLHDVLYVAKTVDELKSNIENKRIFRPGKGIDDLVEVTSMKDDHEFFEGFTRAVLNCVED